MMTPTTIYVAFGGDWQHALAAGVAGFFCAMLAYEVTSRP